MKIDIVLGQAQGRGGLENVITLVSNELQKRGYQIRVFQIGQSMYQEWEESLPEVYYYGLAAHESYPEEQDLIKYALSYRDMLDILDYPDVILATHTPLLSALCRLAVAHLGKKNEPVIFSWLHGPPDVWKGGPYLHYAKDGHLAISKSIGSQIAKYVDKEKVYYIGNPIDFENVSPIQQGKNTLKLIFVGRLSNTEKRIDILFEGLKSLLGKWSLSLIGDGQNKIDLQHYAEKLGIQNHLIWHGWSDIPWEKAVGASALVLSSDYEGFGLVVVEALARGVPVISTACGGPNEMIKDGINGWLFPCGDSQKLHNILQDILDGKKVLPDAETCMRSVDKYRVENVVDRMEQAIHETLERRS
ncbi:glycosyltransferase [Sporolactobacillus sp. STSJ-5]|uniref:glycosyltransferase n=1 Tax=Sporolactobacillus sp. STSJ-5 TaxID=2965076 RepID=UPI0021077A1B|nr:glycosyltransferase [Sporolactobacillus sp. STSJ-5]MCQ2011623.1 glycosyltransferase [Sporolactobacillus sp. STSJ-5]